MVAYRLADRKVPEFIAEMVKKRKSSKFVNIKVPNYISSKVLLRILEFLYCGTFVSKIDMKELESVIKVCEKLEFEYLIRYINSSIEKHDLISK